MKHAVLSSHSALFLSVCFLLLPTATSADGPEIGLPADVDPTAGKIEWIHYQHDSSCSQLGGAVIHCGAQGSYHIGRPPNRRRPDGCVTSPVYEYIRRRYESWPAAPAPGHHKTVENSQHYEFASGADDAIEIAVVDVFNRSVHGVAVSAVIESVDPSAKIRLYALDDPALDESLGAEVNDLRVLAALCAIRNGTETGRIPKPDLVNLSVGRKLLHNDLAPRDHSSETTTPAAPCTDSRISCEIGRVLDWLRSETTDPVLGEGTLMSKRTVTVAAAGNHGLPTFPAALSSTLSAGAIDISHLEEHGSLSALRESGPVYDALMPSQNLCLYDTPTPFGTSFAAALLTGALAANRQPVPVPATGVWGIGRSTAHECIQLTFDGSVGRECLAAGTDLFNGIFDLGPRCWGEPLNSLPVLDPTDTSGPDRSIVTLQEFNTQGGDLQAVTPQPETPYCVPCSGGLDEDGFAGQRALGTLEINTSNTRAFPNGVYVHEIWYRYLQDDAFQYTLVVDDSAGHADRYQDGLIDSLQLANTWVPLGQQPSLEFVLKGDDAGDCDSPNSCYRTSIPILIGGSSE